MKKVDTQPHTCMVLYEKPGLKNHFSGATKQNVCRFSLCSGFLQIKEIRTTPAPEHACAETRSFFDFTKPEDVDTLNGNNLLPSDQYISCSNSLQVFCGKA